MHRMIDDCFSTMPWDKIDNVVFDVGNVLLQFDPQTILDDYLPDVPALHARLMSKIFKSPYWVMMDRGVLSCEEAAEAMIGRDEDLAPYIRKVMREWIEMEHVVTEGVDALKKCKAHGKKLYVLSNYGAKPFDHVDEKYDFFRLFDGKVISGKEKLMKPEAAIYALLLRSYDLEAERTLFIDDSYVNIEAAMRAGLWGMCYNAKGKLKAFFG